MLIESITLKNFRQYKGMQTINFSIDQKKNVTVITGQNTCGKTTLVQSFIWCLYGITNFSDKEILNAEVKNEIERGLRHGRDNASVIVRLRHNDIDYIIERSQDYEVKSSGKTISEQNVKMYECDRNGKSISIPKNRIESMINDILPEGLSDYFFFWGEKIENLSKKSNISAAVKRLLGLDTMQSAISHLNMSINRMIKDMPSSGNSEINILKQKIFLLEKDNKELDELIKQTEIEYKNYKVLSDELYSELMSSNNIVLAKQQEEYKTKTEYREQKKKELEKYEINFKDHFNDPKNYVYFISNKLEKNGVELLKNNPEPVVGWNYIDINAINEILKRGKCICGNETCDGTKEYNYLMEQKKLVSPNVVGGVINSFIEESERRETFNHNYHDLLHNDYRKICELSDELIDLDYSISELSKVVFGKSDVKEKKKKYDEILNKLEINKVRIGSLQEKKNININNIQMYQSKISDLAKKNKKLEKYQFELKMARNLLEIFSKEYSSSEMEIKKKLEKYVDDNFQNVYSGERKIKINDQYIATPYNLVGDKWVVSEPSPGLETVKNFSFITGLVQCAKEKILANDEEEKVNKNSYPLILDAPFSQADEIHVPAISSLISNKAEQIVLVVMEKDWNYAKSVLNSKVGYFYNLEKQTETRTTVREVI